MATDGITYRTDDPDKWVTGKGANLTATEVDQNFWELYSRLKNIEDNPPTAVSISNIQVEGSQLMFFLDDGSTFGPFTLPVATFQLRGDYEIGQTYYELDMVRVPTQGLFLVRIGFTATDPFDAAATDGDGNALFLPLFTVDYYTYTIGMFFPGKVGAGFSENDIIMGHMFAQETFIDTDAPGSVAQLYTPPTADMSLPLYINDDPLGTIDWLAGDYYGTFTMDSVTFTSGDIITVRMPASVDADARNLFITMIGKKTPATTP